MKEVGCLLTSVFGWNFWHLEHRHDQRTLEDGSTCFRTQLVYHFVLKHGLSIAHQSTISRLYGTRTKIHSSTQRAEDLEWLNEP